jgi:hypothetical protein
VLVFASARSERLPPRHALCKRPHDGRWHCAFVPPWMDRLSMNAGTSKLIYPASSVDTLLPECTWDRAARSMHAQRAGDDAEDLFPDRRYSRVARVASPSSLERRPRLDLQRPSSCPAQGGTTCAHRVGRRRRREEARRVLWMFRRRRSALQERRDGFRLMGRRYRSVSDVVVGPSVPDSC